MIRVLVVDDSLFMRTMIRDMLEKDPEIEVVATAIDGMDALKKIDEHAPDVMTLDIEMPRMNGLEVLKRLAQAPSRPKILMLSSLTSEGAEMTRAAMMLGADDFMLKPRDTSAVRGISRELIEKIHNLVRIAYVRRVERPQEILADRLVAIGASAGGPPMLDILLSSFESPLPAAVVITQHMPEGGFTASLATRLNRISPMPVKETESGDILRHGCVYISKGGYHTVIAAHIGDNGKKGGRIIHSQSPPVHSVRPAVDKTFVSAANTFGNRVVSVILSGMGTDGGEGMAAVKQQGGKTIVCREEDCLVYGMARAALSRNCVDRVLPLSQIGKELQRIVTGMVN